MAIDISEAFTLAVREVAPKALEKGLRFSFDYRGPRDGLGIEPLAMQRSLARLFDGVVDLLDAGLIVFDAEIRRSAAGRRLLRVKAAASGLLAGVDRQSDCLARLKLHDTPFSDADRPRLRRASGHWCETGGLVEFVSHPAEGLMFTLQAGGLERFEGPGLGRGIAPHASNAQAWLIHDDVAVAGSLARRMGRLGWTTSSFRSPRHAALRLRTQPPGRPMPALVIITESASGDADQAIGLRPLLAPWTRCIYAIAPGSPARHDLSPAYELRVHPFSPAELDTLSAWLASEGDGPSDESFPMPLNTIRRPRLLVADKDAVRRIVTAGMAQCLGYEVESARDGLQAIDKCLRSPPSVILMDIDMPRMNGLDATRRIRALQRSGSLPPCSVLATTTVDSDPVRRACADAGADGCVSRPLFLGTLRSELRRVCAGSERER